jgi:hypothetical protein
MLKEGVPGSRDAFPRGPLDIRGATLRQTCNAGSRRSASLPRSFALALIYCGATGCKREDGVGVGIGLD